MDALTAYVQVVALKKLVRRTAVVGLLLGMTHLLALHLGQP